MKAKLGISNDPWIRNGAIILFMHIRKMNRDEDFSEMVKDKIDYNDLSISYDDYQDLKNILAYIIKNVQSDYIKTKNKDVKIDLQNNTIETIDRESFSPLTKFFFIGIVPQPQKRIKYELNEIPDKLQQEYKKILEDVHQKEKMEIYDSCAKLNTINIDDFNHKGHCDFCGNDAVYIDKIKTKYYRFAASLNKYGNFYSNFRSNLNICIFCAISSFLVYEKLPFLISNKKLFFAIPIIDLRFKNFWKHINFNTGENALNKDYGNIGNISVDGIFNAFINLIYYLNEKIDEIKDESIEKEKNQWRNLSWMIGSATDKHIINIYTYNDTAKLSNLIYKLKNKNINLPAFIRNFVIINGKNKNSVYSNEISRLIMYSQDINREIEQFYSERIKSGNPNEIKFLNSFIMIYNKEVIKMEEKDLKACCRIGKKIGEYCKGDKEKGIPEDKDMLYELRSCTNLRQFLQFFDRATFKIDDLYIPYNFLSRIDNNNWQDLKSVISIFAHQEFYNKKEVIKNEQ